ncbi:MAG: dCTP deaminase [Candidatus Paceibacteria bacterium]|jgi:dCTP deaminase
MKRKYHSNDRGALAHQNLMQLRDTERIIGIITEDQFQPASLDLTLSSEAYEVPGILLPTKKETVRDVLVSLGNEKKISLDQPLEIGKTYLIRLNQKLKLPSDVYGYSNPKSSTGRVDVHVRLLSDGVPRFDGVSKGYQGEIWISVIPKSFRVIVKEGLSLCQIRLFNADTRLRGFEFEALNKSEKLIWDQHTERPVPSSEVNTYDGDGSVILSLDLGNGIGFQALTTEDVLDMSMKNHDPENFFKRVCAETNQLHLQNRKFYILSTCEGIRIPPNLASEIAPMDERCGEFRSHYAGFFDPGWGWGNNGEGTGDTATLEVRPFENIIIRHRDPVCRFKFERMIDPPKVTYGNTGVNHYGGQRGARLSKHFLPWKD